MRLEESHDDVVVLAEHNYGHNTKDDKVGAVLSRYKFSYVIVVQSLMIFKHASKKNAIAASSKPSGRKCRSRWTCSHDNATF